MDMHEQREAWVPVDDQFAFSHTTIIFKDRATKALFYTRTKQRYRPNEAIDINSLTLTPIPLDDVFPSLSCGGLTEAPNPLPLNTFVKRPNLVDYPELVDRYRLSDMLLEEARICEILMRSPHPNIVKYLGVVTENNRLTGLCFAKYVMTLAERLADNDPPLNRNLCLAGIESGIQTLHNLGLVHNDLNPHNIMLEANDTPVIIDFDSCRREGEVLGLKAGTIGWADENFKIAKPENDYYGLRRIEEEMRRHSEPVG
jgi:serine/threonine protein kinase